MLKTLISPFLKIFKAYYNYCGKRKVKQGYWTCYSGISGLFMHDSGLKGLVDDIKNGLLTNKLFTFNEKNTLLQNILKYLVDSIYENDFNQPLLEEFCKECPDLVIKLARLNSSILSDLRVKIIIMNYSFMAFYRAELCQIWQISPDQVNDDSEKLKQLVGVGSKNSAPSHLVKEMYDLQEKGCPVPPNKGNKPAG